MVWITLLGILLFLISCLHSVHLHKELKHLEQQLHCIQEGSHITMTSLYQEPSFLKIYQLLNQLQKKQEETRLLYQNSQKELQDTITSLAHDLRTPLTSAMGYLQIMEEEADVQKKREYQEISLQRLQDLRKLLESLFLYTKVIHREFIEETEDIHLYPILSACMLELYQHFQNQEIEVSVQFSQEDMQVKATKEILQRTFQNLLLNALEHGTLFLHIQQEGNMIQFCNGLKEEAVPDPTHMFDRFYKADPSRHAASSGLGLAIVKELVDQLHGSIEASIQNDQLWITLCF